MLTVPDPIRYLLRSGSITQGLHPDGTADTAWFRACTPLYLPVVLDELLYFVHDTHFPPHTLIDTTSRVARAQSQFETHPRLQRPAEMDPPPPPKSANLFQVYLRLRPAPTSVASSERFLLVEDPEESDAPSHITLNPPNDRRRAIEKFAFTRVFEEDATQLDLFRGTRVLPLVEGALAPHGGDGTDGLLATLGVTGSGKVGVDGLQDTTQGRS